MILDQIKDDTSLQCNGLDCQIKQILHLVAPQSPHYYFFLSSKR